MGVQLFLNANFFAVGLVIRLVNKEDLFKEKSVLPSILP
jgi:hypothetical protein